MSDPLAISARPETPGLHPLVGFTSADDSARLIRHYRYAVERMMRILGGWIALTPELSAKLLLGRHVWDIAQHADLLGKRLPELRAPAQTSEPANAAFVAFMDALEEAERPPETVERLVGVYRVLKPHLLASYEDHLRRVNEVYEPPTQRIIARMIEDERRHIGAGQTVLGHLVRSPVIEARGRAWQQRLEEMLAVAGGVTGGGLPAPARIDAPAPAAMLSDDAGQLIRLEQSVTRWPMPEALESALRDFGDALVARDIAGVSRWLTPASAGPGGADAELATLGLLSHRVVAFARIGRKRVVKLRLEGRAGAGTLVTRWMSTPEGWRAEWLDTVSVDIARPA